MNILYVIPARGGSKGIPRKNIKLLNGKPLISYAIDTARSLATDDNICVSTDDDEIIQVVENYGLKVPFKRPEYLATDSAGTNEVLLHALDFYEKQGQHYDVIVLLQPTSPFRSAKHVEEAVKLYSSEVDMVVSVKEATANPYYNCFEENQEGVLQISKGDGHYTRRQDAPKVYEYNGAVYVINTNSLKQRTLSQFNKRVKYVMDDFHSLDLDNMNDWVFAECLMKNNTTTK